MAPLFPMNPPIPLLVLCAGLLTPFTGAFAAPAPKPVNLLFIITDQQRWDAMGCAGNPVLKTPNMDKLAQEGARFTRFYSACPVCAPARTSILTGRSIETNHVVSNNDIDRADAGLFPSFDQILLRGGYHGEYHGKYHSPYGLAVDYSRPVRWLNGKRPPAGCLATSSDADAFRSYLAANVPKRELKPNELIQSVGIYTPIELDINYGKTNGPKSSQADSYGRLEVSPEHSITAFTAREGIEALDRLKGAPFTLTISIDPPHPPMIVAEPFFSMYPPKEIVPPASLEDMRTNSPYPIRAGDYAYRSAKNIQEMTSIYYGMVSEVDTWIGKIMSRLEELGLADNTLVIFTSDHGEMIGEHNMHGKFVFYEGSVHVPLLARSPGRIPKNTVIHAPASHLDIFPTILDYLDQKAPEFDGKSLRPLIEGREDGAGRIAVSEWGAKNVPGFMVFDGRWKFLYGRSADSKSLDALYDLETDPHEIHNLIGRNPEREKYQPEVTRMKGLLIDWMVRVKSPHIETVKARALFATPPPSGS